METGEFTLNSTQFKVRSLFARVSQTFEFMAREQRLLFKAVVSDRVPEMIYSDEARLG